MNDMENSTYYLGNIIVKPEYDKLTGETIITNHLIDGQQRLTTLLLLIKALKHNISYSNLDTDLIKEYMDILDSLIYVNGANTERTLKILNQSSNADLTEIMDSTVVPKKQSFYHQNYKYLVQEMEITSIEDVEK